MIDFSTRGHSPAEGDYTGEFLFLFYHVQVVKEILLTDILTNLSTFQVPTLVFKVHTSRNGYLGEKNLKHFVLEMVNYFRSFLNELKYAKPAV